MCGSLAQQRLGTTTEAIEAVASLGADEDEDGKGRARARHGERAIAGTSGKTRRDE
jgi:hypothetical protein